MPNRITILSLVLFAFLGSISYAQNFPVRVTPILTPPYTPFLTDYTDAGSEKLTVQILLNDVTVPEYRCKLRLTIEGVNISITTNPGYVPLPIVLSGGVPQIVYGSDLSEYFKPSNLVFQGINQNDFERKGSQLPEGIYRISIEVLDYNRNTVVSNKGSATAWMILNDPPFINMPVNNSKLRPLNPQNIVFQWTPRHRGSPNAAFTTEYEVKMVEIWPAGRNPYDAINTSRPIFETTVDNTLVVYGPAETPLVLGREYALQVRARDTGGKDLFKNNGYSEVIRFVYGDECPLPSGLFADDLGTMKARMRWQGNGQNTGYILRFREKKQGAQWFEERTNQTFVNSTAMRAGATYEYQVCGECEGFRSEYTKEQTFTTLAENPNAFVCGGPSTVPPPDGSAPLPALFINDFIKAGGFDVVVTKATGSNGRFSGEGLAVIPWFNSAKVRMTFKDVSVNKSYQLTAGDIVSVWDPNSKSLRVEEKTLAEGGGKGLDGLATVEADTLIQLTGSIITVFINSDSSIVVQTNQGDVVIPKEKGKSYAVADQLGNGYLIDKDGKITKTTATDVANAAARGQREYSKDPNLSVRFAKAEGTTKYGFDEQREGTLQENYQQTENGKWIAWKALPSGKTDVVAVTAEGTTELSKAKFKVEGSTPQVLTPNTLSPNSSSLNSTSPNTQVLSLTGSTHGITEELLAYYPQQDTSKDDVVVGKLNMVSYDEVQKSLVIVEVNNATYTGNINTLTNELNKTYAQGVARWTSVTKQSITVSGLGEKLDDGESGLLSNYTPDMKTVLNAFTKNNTLANDTYYLFLIKAANDPDKLGYMPRKKQAGFIFLEAHGTQNIEDKLINTIAHELGHGAFRLKHTFSEDDFIAAKGTTDNLMDYNRGMRLNKYQWDYIHNPEAVLGLFEGDEESAMTTLDEATLERIADNVLVGDFILEKEFQNPDGISPAEEYVYIKGFDVLFQLVAKEDVRVIAFEDKSKSKTYFWDDAIRWYKSKDGIEYDNYWPNDLLNAGIMVVRPMAILAGADPKGRESLKVAYQNYDGTLVGFVGKLAKDGVVELVSDVVGSNGAYRQNQALLGVWMGSSFATPSLGLVSTLSKNLLKVGVKLGGKTLTTWSFVTLLNVQIFRYSLENNQFIFSNALRSAAATTVIYSIRDIRYVTDIDPAVKLGTVELVKDASGNIFWRELASTTLSWLDNVYTSQKNLITQFKNLISSETNLRKGNFGEMASDVLLSEKGYQPLHTRLIDIDAPTKQGIDGVFKKGNDYFVVESKYKGSATLGTLVDGTKQMSSAWIIGNNRLLDVVGSEIFQEMNAVGFKRILAEVAPDGTIIFKELDGSANVIGSFIP